MGPKDWLKSKLAIYTVIPRSNIDFILFVVSTIFTILMAILYTKAALGALEIPILFVWAYISLTGTHGVHTITLYFYKLAYLHHERERQISITVWRYGEIFGFLLLNYIALFNPLYILGITKVFPGEGMYLFDGLVAVLAGTSLSKMWIGQQPRVHYNRLFFLTTVITTISVLTSITIGAMYHKSVPPEMTWMLFVLFIAHTIHDRLLKITCEIRGSQECDEDVSDYLITFIVLAWGLGVVILYFFGITISQGDFFQLFAVVPFITIVSVIIQNWKIDQIKKRKEEAAGKLNELEKVKERLDEATEEIRENIAEERERAEEAQELKNEDRNHNE